MILILWVHEEGSSREASYALLWVSRGLGISGKCLPKEYSVKIRGDEMWGDFTFCSQIRLSDIRLARKWPQMAIMPVLYCSTVLQYSRRGRVSVRKLVDEGKEPFAYLLCALVLPVPRMSHEQG